jgi:prepilin-type N-terminal cleavage/methylation domain-containing protein
MNANCCQSRGFTLVELMCSMAIGSVILILAASVLGSSSEGYERVGGSVASEREARALITQLASDLSSGRFHKEEVIGKSVAAWPVDRLGFLSLQPGQAQTNTGRIGDLCAVSYYVKDLSIDGKIVRCLMRGFRESSETFNALRGESIAPLFAANAVLDEPVAFGVVSFEARPKSRDDDGKWVGWIQNDTTGPESLDIKLVLARRELAGRLKSPGDWDAAGMLGRHKGLESYATTLGFGNHAN